MTTAPTTPARRDGSETGPARPDSGPGRNIGWIVAGSLVTGLVVGLLLAAAPFIPAEESAVTGALLCGFALGWAMLAVLSMNMKGFPSETESHTGPVTKRPLAQPSTVAP